MKRATRLAVLVLCLDLSPITHGQAVVQAPAGYPALGEPPRITVISTGTEPRQALRYVVPSGYRAHMNMDMTMGMTMSMAGQSMPLTGLPPMRLGADMAVTGVSPAGDIAYSMAFTGMGFPKTDGLDPAALAPLDALTADIKSIAATATLSSRGINRDLHVDTSKVSNPQFSQMMDSMTNSLNGISMPFAEEPVGIGARWEVRQALASVGVTMWQKVDCEVAALDSRSATLKITLAQTAPSQPMKNPNLPPGAEMTIDTLTGTGSGTMSVPLDGLVPTSEMNNKITMVVSTTVGGARQQMTMETTLKLLVAPGKN